jgi:selenocysteine-specific elongation factor
LHTLRGDRLVLRDQSARRTVGGGVVIDPAPDMRGHSRDERRAYLAAMALPDAETALPAALLALPGGLDLELFARSWNLDEEQRLALRREPTLRLCGASTTGITVSRWQALEQAVLAALHAEHEAHPERLGSGERELEKALRARLARGVFDAVLEALVSSARVARDGAVLRLPEHSARRSPADEALWKRVRPLLEKDTLKAPVVHDLATALNLNHTLLEAFLIRASKQGLVVKVSAKRYFLPQAMTRFEQLVRELTAGGSKFAAADFRDRAAVGRNAVIEILEYFDRIGLTHRSGDLRTLLDTRRRS